jgi:sugar phosphate isomerase/epimerase
MRDEINKYSRREFGKTALSALALSAAAPALPAFAAQTKLESTVRGVRIGLITGTLNPLPTIPGKDPIDVIIEECIKVGAANIELAGVQFPWGQPAVVRGGRFGQPPETFTPEYIKSREEQRQWRINQPLDRYVEVKNKFAKAGLNLFSAVLTVGDDFTDAEIDASFKQLQALGVPMFTSNQTRVGMGRRISVFAEKYNIMPSYHPHAQVHDPNEIATAESMETLLAMSPLSRINLDIGHFTAGNGDAVAFLKKHHAKVTHLHVKDRRRNGGPNVRLGTGDTPIKECLLLIRDNKWPIICALEREFRGEGSSVAEQMDFMRQILNS